MHKQSQYEDLIKHLQSQLIIALAEEERLKTLAEEASSKSPLITADTPSGKVSGRQLWGETGEAIKEAHKKLDKHQRGVVNSIKSNIAKANQVIDIINRANYDIGEIKFFLI